MKKLIISSTLFMASFSASAADLPSLKTVPASSPLPLWTGLYAGLNAGYGFGTNGAIDSINYGAQKSFLNVLATPSAVASAFSGLASNTQNGFIGGFQFGYNYQIGQSFVLGLETDIQGSNISGTSVSKGAGLFSNSASWSQITGTQQGSVSGSQTINSGLDYLGTIRARAGYLITPTLLAYGTAGFTYGGAYTKINSYGIESQSLSALDSNASITLSIPGVTTYVGDNRQSQILTGWNAGGGAEWMFMPNWSLKAEAIYWNLGSMNAASSMVALAPVSSVSGAVPTLTGTAPLTSNAISTGLTQVNYQGIIARAGLNYHFLSFGGTKDKNTLETAAITPETWNGAYAGLNAGYGFGTNSAINSTNYEPAKTVFDLSGSTNAVANALSINSRNSQNGFVGGMQFGYNHILAQRFLIGIETDIQGANIYGTGYGRGAGLYNLSDTIGSATGSLNGAVLGSQTIDAGVNYLGTLRGRMGYMLSPAVLLYGTAGFSYGGASAKVTNYAIDTFTGSGSVPNASGTFLLTSTYYGTNQQNQLLTGWNAGGGVEWMFMPNWSLKGEAIYWNLGNMNVATNSVDISPAQSLTISTPTNYTIPLISNSLASGQTTINYQGIIARAGINYHFSWATTPIVAKP